MIYDVLLLVGCLYCAALACVMKQSNDLHNLSVFEMDNLWVSQMFLCVGFAYDCLLVITTIMARI